MKTNNKIKIRKLKGSDCEVISQAFKNQGWEKRVEQYQKYLKEQEVRVRDVLIALINGNFAGYLTIMWKSNYPYFRENQIPEIVDLNVLKKFQKMGVASTLMDFAEKMVSKKSKIIGIGVGLSGDYGNAQRLYVKRGYVPDGLGISQNEKYPEWGETVKIDDNLVLCFTKELQDLK